MLLHRVLCFCQLSVRIYDAVMCCLCCSRHDNLIMCLSRSTSQVSSVACIWHGSHLTAQVLNSTGISALSCRQVALTQVLPLLDLLGRLSCRMAWHGMLVPQTCTKHKECSALPLCLGDGGCKGIAEGLSRLILELISVQTGTYSCKVGNRVRLSEPIWIGLYRIYNPGACWCHAGKPELYVPRNPEGLLDNNRAIILVPLLQ